MYNYKTYLFRFAMVLAIVLFICQPAVSADINGSFIKWHKVELSFTGPSTNELATPNPFTDYRVDVTFTGPSAQVYKVPGYYAADGDAAETSADTGSVWRVNFCPDEVGTWNYEVSFVSGELIAAELEGGSSAGFFDGETGSFDIDENMDADPKDFRNKGKLIYTGEHFLRFTETDEYFVKAGANSPEVFLEYAEFDNTPSDRLYPDHIADWQDGDPIWQDDKGKGIVGVVNYLSSIDINAYYFLTMNAYGDGKKAWPFIHQDSIVRYDCSKLDQWDIVFHHMNATGIMVHFVLTETENESFFEVVEDGEPGGFADSRKIYYREMVARYGYLPALTWNIGEENGWAHSDPYQVANTDQQRKDACDRIRELAYYNDHISIHNGPSNDDYIYDALLGHASHTGPAFQWDNSNSIYQKILEWRTKSAEADHKWVVSLDEPYTGPEYIGIDNWRKKNVWATYMAGGAGIELYIGSGLDLSVQNFRDYEEYYNVMTLAADFLRSVPFDEMEPDEDAATSGWALNYQDSLYLFYFGKSNDKTAILPEGDYEVSWFNPRTGGDIEQGQVSKISGGAEVALGNPPSDPDLDWLCVISKTDDLAEAFELIDAPSGRSFDEGDANLELTDTIVISATGMESSEIECLVSDPDLISVVWVSQEDTLHSYALNLLEGANALSPGEYSLLVAFNADSAASLTASYPLTVIEVPDLASSINSQDLDLKLLSNIGNSNIELIGQCKSLADVRIYNMNGSLVYQQKFHEITNEEINISALQKGSYIIRVNAKEGSSLLRFVKI